ncbi:CD209 antigen-like protein E [Acanthopagrus latus]|uniref:CD209 antigen-like protein E n=1 Tax=Acanthopagrus latus TaxID=8177 RepID=UPI00187C49EC|nr:CD209 antigen-like protein E [Acanthopagrus latus]
MEEIYVNSGFIKSVEPRPSTNQRGPRRFHGAVVLCLGLLCVVPLAGLISLGVAYYASERCSAAHLSTIRDNLTECLQASNTTFPCLTENGDLLKDRITETTKEPRCSCPEGWKMFHCACFFLSGESGNWDKGRDDCIDRGADLVVINSAEEQTFLSNFTKEKTMAWIGMTDRVKEGAWTWIDRTPVTFQYWKTSQPDNGGGHHTLGHEDCAHIIIGGSHLNWNDLSCKTSLRWICEKVV